MVGDEKYSTAFGRDIIASIPLGSIYFSGSDPGRFIVSAMCHSQIDGDPGVTKSFEPRMTRMNADKFMNLSAPICVIRGYFYLSDCVAGEPRSIQFSPPRNHVCPLVVSTMKFPDCAGTSW